MIKFCKSCGAPLNEEFKGSSELYCKYCVNEKGELKSKEEVRQGITCYMKMLDDSISDESAYKRAGHYIKAMPAWAED